MKPPPGLFDEAQEALIEYWESMRADIGQPDHGRPNTYKWWGCRCERCVTAHRAYERSRESKRSRHPVCPRPVAQCGTWSKYTRGCRCPDCRTAAHNRYLFRKASFNPDEAMHGIHTTYLRGCRCSECREAARQSRASWKNGKAGQEPRRHGTASAYISHGCRCKECRAWKSRDREGVAK